eukprot:782144-Prymnesium_polylepis.1
MSKEDCCQSCGAAPKCAKFSWEEGGKTCTLHEAFAERIKVQDQISGAVDSKLMGQGASFQSKKANTTFKVAYLIWAGPPSLPSFAALYSVISPPPPPPENGKSDSDVTQKVIEKVSFGVVVIMFG